VLVSILNSEVTKLQKFIDWQPINARKLLFNKKKIWFMWTGYWLHFILLCHFTLKTALNILWKGG